MPLNQPLNPTTIALGDLDHPGLHTQERNLIEEIRSVADQEVISATVTGAATIDYGKGRVHVFTLTGATTLSFPVGPTGPNGQAISVTLLLQQDNTGGRIVTWQAAPRIQWSGGVAPSLTTGANRKDLLVFTSFDNGSAWFGALAMKDVR